MEETKINISMNRHNDPVYEAMFDDLIQEVFDFSFAPWFACKLWDERYESYSIIQEGKMLSNVCIYKTDMLLRGKTLRVHQFGGIATRKSVRRKGLSRILMEHVLSLYADIPAFLYANSSVTDFYPLFGFRRAQAYRPGIATEINNPSGKAVKYDARDSFISEALNGNRIYSDIADSLNTQPIQTFHLLLDYPDSIYFLPDCGAVVIAEQNYGVLFLADVISQSPISFDKLKSELPFSGVNYVEFGFCPDWLGVDPRWEPEDEVEEPFFLIGDWSLPETFRFPAMSVT